MHFVDVKIQPYYKFEIVNIILSYNVCCVNVLLLGIPNFYQSGFSNFRFKIFISISHGNCFKKTSAVFLLFLTVVAFCILIASTVDFCRVFFR